MKWLDEFISAAEELEWRVIEDEEDHAEFGKFSPAGQDFWMEVAVTSPENLLETMRSYINNYDISENAYIWLDDTGHGKNGAPYDMKDVYEDMEACLNMVKELYSKLCQIEL